MQLRADGSDLVATFQPVQLHFLGQPQSNVFARKNNRSMGETLQHHRYAKLRPEALVHCRDEFDLPLGEVLLRMKLGGVPFYLRFLNAYGDLTYAEFCIRDASVISSPGIYAYVNGSELVYVGRCLDSMGKRINQGYGRIHPKNCFLDGQSTNCRINAEIAKIAGTVALWFCPMARRTEIESGEIELIQTYKPAWNVRGVE